MNRHEKQSIEKYNIIAADYDLTFEGRFTVKFKNKILALCDVSDGDAVLDVGCGNGTLINAINKKGNINAFGVDISPQMVKECQKRYNNISFKISTGEQLPFESNSFNILTICCVLHHLNNPHNFFIEAKRVLKSSGILIVGEPWYPIGLRQFVDWVVAPLLKAGDNKTFSHKKLKELFVDNGFEIIEIYKNGNIQIIKGRKI